MHLRRVGDLVALDRHPLVVFLLGLCVISGIANLVTPNPAAPHVPLWINRAWYLLLIGGGLTALVGVFWRDVVTGILVVRAGLLFVGAGAYAYAVVVGHHGLNRYGETHQERVAALLGAVVILGLGVAAHWRVVQATLHVRAEIRRKSATRRSDPSGQPTALPDGPP